MRREQLASGMGFCGFRGLAWKERSAGCSSLAHFQLEWLRRDAQCQRASWGKTVDSFSDLHGGGDVPATLRVVAHLFSLCVAASATAPGG